MCDCVGVVRKGHARCNHDLGKCSKNAEIKSTPLLNLKHISPAIYWCMHLCAMMFCVCMCLALGSVRACRIAAWDAYIQPKRAHISKKKFILFHLFHLIPYLNLLFWG